MARVISLSGLGLFGVAIFLAVGSAEAQTSHPPSFRIDTDIYQDPTKAPIKRTLTLFSDGIYYDFEEAEGGLVTVIDPQRNRIVLLNRQRQVKSELDTRKIQTMIVNARRQADAKLVTFTNRQFSRSANDREEAIVENEFIQYRATLQVPIEPDMARQYAEFADWSARLNALYQPKLPPYLRLELNHLIVERQALPSEIVRVTRQNDRRMELICRLIPAWQLSQDDQLKIARCSAMLAEFQSISVEEYWNSSPSSVVRASAEAPASKPDIAKHFTSPK